ncbi:MAG: hypothetical protein IKE30_07395 [Clostridia bacterium]|nr:hypothetical protein [Clostridia bacterium]
MYYALNPKRCFMNNSQSAKKALTAPDPCSMMDSADGIAAASTVFQRRIRQGRNDGRQVSAAAHIGANLTAVFAF